MSSVMDPLSQLISERVMLARKDAGLSQEALAVKLGFKDRQSVSNIELRLRKVSKEELVKISGVLEKPLSFFTDPYTIAESNAFSYRANQAAQADLEEFERSTEKLISANRRFRGLLGIRNSPVQPELRSMSRQMPLDFATYQGETIAESLMLGAVPALKLRQAIEEKYGISILFVDAPDRISGAACRLADESVILINRNEPAHRRNFDLGHEFFHILTWGEMPPEKIDNENSNRSKVEKLADAFTAGLLMPRSVVVERWNARGDTSLLDWIHQNAQELVVSSEALYWRLINMKYLSADKLGRGEVLSTQPARASSAETLFDRQFVQNLRQVLDQGLMTVLKATHLLDCDIVDLKELFESYELPVPFNY